MSRFELDPERSQVWIDGSSSVHPIRATATGLTGWIELEPAGADITAAALTAAEVHVTVDRLGSGNPLVDRETRRRIDASSYPEIVGTVTGAERIGPERLAVTGDIAFRGEVRSVSGEIAVSLDGTQLIVEGTHSFDVRDWGLRLPRLGFLRVHPDVNVRIRAVGNPVS